MTALRYAEALAPTLAWLDLEHRGWGVVVTAPGEQSAVAAALRAAHVGSAAIELSAGTAEDWLTCASPSGNVVTLSLELDDPARARILTNLNGHRDFSSDLAVWVLIVSGRELEQVRRHAPDLASAFRSFQQVPFIPRDLSPDELARARSALHTHYRDRFGRLDLRGFIRSEHEDVSFAVEDVFQPLQATRWAPNETALRLVDPRAPAAPVVDHLAALRDSQISADFKRAALLVGAPGSGKSFFLRWCALTASSAASFLGIDGAVPLHVPLAAMRAASRGDDIETFIIESLLDANLDIGHAARAEADAGRAIFLFDGLDEVGPHQDAVLSHVGVLLHRYPACLAVITSRPAGLGELPFPVLRLDLQPLDDDSVRRLLATWCELYEVERTGRAGAARGRAEGETLASQVLSSPVLSDLARIPLLATIIAIVHRAGVRLPDHRVELYDHITRILVERWNQLRSRDAGAPAPTIRVADAIRLLGPVAYDMVASDRDGAIDEAALRTLLARQLARGTVRAISTADQAVATFRDSLGVLVEQSPGVYSFLHKTLGEFFAAHDIVRSGVLERLVETEGCFDARWREVVLLALGIVGQLQADDDRLERAIERLLGHYRRRGAADRVPEFLARMVADDPPLSDALIAETFREIASAWREIRLHFSRVIELASETFRLLGGPGRTRLTAALRAEFADGTGRSARGGEDWRAALLIPILVEAGFTRGPLECDMITRALIEGMSDGESPLRYTWWAVTSQVAKDASLEIDVERASRAVAAIARRGGAELFVLHTGQNLGQPKPVGGLLIRDGRFFVDGAAAGELVMISLVAPPPERSPHLVTIVLDVWRELCAKDTGAPRPPATVAEAIERYR